MTSSEETSTNINSVRVLATHNDFEADDTVPLNRVHRD